MYQNLSDFLKAVSCLKMELTKIKKVWEMLGLKRIDNCLKPENNVCRILDDFALLYFCVFAVLITKLPRHKVSLTPHQLTKITVPFLSMRRL